MPVQIEDVILYSVPEVSQMLNVTPVSIRNYIRQGYLNGQKVLGRWVVEEEALRDFMDRLS